MFYKWGGKMNIQELGSIQILNSLGINLKNISENELNIIMVLLDKLFKDNNLNDYTIDIRTNSFIIFIKDNNTLKIYNNIKDCSLEILFNGNMIGKFNIYQKYINFIESINDETRDWNIENNDYLNIEVNNKPSFNPLAINAKSIGLVKNDAEYIQFENKGILESERFLKPIIADTTYDKYAGVIAQIDDIFNGKKTFKVSIYNRVRHLLKSHNK